MTSAAKVGIFMIVVLAILGFFILRVEDVEIGGRETKEVDVIFDDVAGLDEKSAVRVAGVRVGTVKTIHPPTPEGKARVTLEIDRNVQLFPGARGVVTSMGLLGEKYVELEPGDPKQPAIGDTERLVLSGSATASIDQVTDQVSLIAADVKAITASLRNVLGGPAGERRIEEIVTNVQAITARLRFLIEANEGNVTATAENLRAITADLRVEIPRIANSIDRFASTMTGTVGENREDVRAVVANLRNLSADLRTTATNLNDITGQVKSGEGTVGKLIYSEEAHSRLTAALGSVEGGVSELRNVLGRVGRMSFDLGVKSEYFIGRDEDPEGFGGNSRSAVIATIVPNPERNRFYNIELVDDPRGEKTEEIKDVVTTVNGVETVTRTRETKFERNFRFSAQAGWSFDELDLRLGLFESTGGVGADYRWRDRTTITGEAFDFGQQYDDNPHVRLFGRYIFRREKDVSPALFITTGVDNPLNDLAFTIGGGIRWRDEDLKYLLGSIPVGR